MLKQDKTSIRKREYAKTPIEKEKRKLYMRVWRAKNRDKHNDCARKSHAKNRHKHTEKLKNYHLNKAYGITLVDKQRMIQTQGGKCLICGMNFKSDRSTHVDHCHITGKIRGILCHVCNTKLAWYEHYSTNISNYLKRLN